MKRVLRITLVTGEVDELDLTTYMLQAKVPLGASAIDPAYIMITQIKCIEIVFDLN